MRTVSCRGYESLNAVITPITDSPDEPSTIEEGLTVPDAGPGCSRSERFGLAILLCAGAYAVVYYSLRWAPYEAGKESNGVTWYASEPTTAFGGSAPLPPEPSHFSTTLPTGDTRLPRKSHTSALQRSREWPVPPPEWRLPKLPRPSFEASSLSRPKQDPGAPTTAASLNARFHRNPWDAWWPADGTLADAGLLIHVTSNLNGHVRVPSYAATGGNMCTTMVYARLKDATNGWMPLFNGGHSGVVFRPGVAQIVCGKPHDSGGSCEIPHCSPDGFINACMWPANETGYYLKKVLEQKTYTGQYNEIMVNTSYWPSNIIEASFGDPGLPPPHFNFDPSDFISPFT